MAELASWDEIKSAYRDLAKRYHPNVCGEETASEIMKLINHAFDVAKKARG
ncbi:DnaJ domain-containing protein [Argonema antarcticum]|uniref:DnaJ domain-containing protein n=1 Tax=Argonema antarcticum TaxID=2942763 RepID=UPI002012423A|nr:DnaJ domain-containing protein [Argonema antarcticum A004/B2]